MPRAHLWGMSIFGLPCPNALRSQNTRPDAADWADLVADWCNGWGQRLKRWDGWNSPPPCCSARSVPARLSGGPIGERASVCWAWSACTLFAVDSVGPASGGGPGGQGQ